MPLYTIEYNEGIFERFGKTAERYFRKNNIKKEVVANQLGLSRFYLATLFKGELIFGTEVLEKLEKYYPNLDNTDIKAWMNDKSLNMYKKVTKQVPIGVYFGFILKNYRKEKGYPLKTLAHLLNIDYTHLHKFELFKYNNITIEHIYSICKVTGKKSSDYLNF
jgi:DNA-binding Xre family transcriptional regulator